MQYIEILFIISWGISAIMLTTLMLLSYLLFKLLKKNHTIYYKSIGEPIVIPLFKLTDTEDDVARTYIRGVKGGFFGYRMIFRGIPKNFPKNARLRSLARAVRIVSMFTLVSFVMFIIAGYFFYRSTKGLL